MWNICLWISILSVVLVAAATILLNATLFKNGKKLSLFRMMFVGAFVAEFFMFLPVHSVTAEAGVMRPILLSVFNSMQVFALGAEFSIVLEGIPHCPTEISSFYLVWSAALYVLAPVFTFGFVLSLFKNISAYIKYLLSFFKRIYVFSELNEKSISLASDIKKNDTENKARIVFTDVFEEDAEESYELLERAKKLDSVLFKKDILAVKFGWHSPKKDILFFALGEDETENLNQTVRLIETYNSRSNTHVYVFSTKIESELLLTAVQKGKVKVRRINEVRSLINRVLYERGELIFESAVPGKGGIKDISAVVVGMGHHGTEMLKALAWFCQMDGYRVSINGFDKDSLAEDKFRLLAPELISEQYNGVNVEGEAAYEIKIHSDCDVLTNSFAEKISALNGATYVFVSLGDDDLNIKTAVNLRMLFERAGLHPVIQAVLGNSHQKSALSGLKNYRGQEYNIEFIGDIESSFAESVIIDSELEEEALERHLKWGEEEEFWAFEYNYRSSVASAIHLRARIKCGIPGASKKNEELTDRERKGIENLEHKRWNAYMRAEGYVYSGSPDKSSRNDLAKMHHDLVDFSSLSEEDKRKDSQVGTI